MKQLKLDLDSLGVETFATVPELAQDEGSLEQDFYMISRRSCIEQCTTSCVP